VEPGLYASHPDVFQPIKHIYGVPASWQGLQENLHMALEVNPFSFISPPAKANE